MPTELGPNRAYRDVALLAATSALFNSPLPAEEAVARVVKETAIALDCLVSVMVPDAAGEYFNLIASHHPDPEYVSQGYALWATLPLSLQTQTGEAFIRSAEVLWPTIVPGQLHPLGVALGIESHMAVAIHSRGETLGILTASSTVPNTFDTHDLRTLKAIANQAANAISNATFMDREIRLRQRAETLLKVSKALRSELDLDTFLQELVDVSWQFLQPQFVGVFMEQSDGSLCLVASPQLAPERQALPPEAATPEGFLSRTLRNVGPVVYANLDQEPLCDVERAFLGVRGPTSCLAIPLIDRGRPRGLLLLTRKAFRDGSEDEDHELMVGLTELAAMAIENTHLMREEAAVHAQKVVAERIAAEREALIRQIVHDLRNSTQAISLVNEELEHHGKDDPTIMYSVSAIDRQIGFISNFLKEKLAWIKQQRSQPTTGASRLSDLIEGMLARHADGFEERSQTLSITLPPEEVDLTLQPGDFFQVLGPLLDNARRFSPTGSEVRLWGALSDGWVTLYVADDGPGISLEVQGHLGEPEHGPGLASVKRLVTVNGGLFGFTSKPGAGSTFYVTLPTTRWGMA